MTGFNKVVLMGRLTRDPEMRYTPKGTAIAQVSLALNRTWLDEQDQKHDEVTFVEAQAWGRTAEVICQYFKKGAPILVEGRLKMDSWDDKNTGQKRTVLRVLIERFTFTEASTPRQNEPSAPRQAASPAKPVTTTDGSPEEPLPDDDDVPF